MNGIDLFAGGGGATTGAKMAGINMLWAANHNPISVDCHALNHPEVIHSCQDLHQADWSQVPEHDLLLASPCCQGHSNAAGAKKLTKKADASRSTAWAVISCLEVHKPPFAVIENVPEFQNWPLYECWVMALEKLGYSLSPHIVNCADLGVPQSRVRLFMIATRSQNPIKLSLPKFDHISARSFIDLNIDGHKWDLVSDRVAKTQMRVTNGRKRYGDIFLDAAYGSARNGRSIDKPLGTVTTSNKHSLIIGDHIRALTIQEQSLAQTFSAGQIWPKLKVETKMMIGNAVPPKAEQQILIALQNAA